MEAISFAPCQSIRQALSRIRYSAKSGWPALLLRAKACKAVIAAAQGLICGILVRKHYFRQLHYLLCLGFIPQACLITRLELFTQTMGILEARLELIGAQDMRNGADNRTNLRP